MFGKNNISKIAIWDCNDIIVLYLFSFESYVVLTKGGGPKCLNFFLKNARNTDLGGVIS